MQFYLAVNARCCVPVPAPCRAGACPRRAALPCPQIPCLPPHSPGGVHAAPTCNGSLCGKHQNHACQTAPRRGQDPALRLYGNCEQNRKYQFPSGRRGGLQAARAILSCREQAVAASTHPCSVGRGLDPAVRFYLAYNVPVCRHIPRAAYTPPLHATGPCAANTKTTPAKLRRGGVLTPPCGFALPANPPPAAASPARSGRAPYKPAENRKPQIPARP